MKSARNILIILISFLFLFISSVCYALPFSIVPKAGTQLPTTVHLNSSVTAYYTVSNLTGTTRFANFVEYLPPNVAQFTGNGTYGDTCQSTFDLSPVGQPGSSCTLQLTITGPVNGNDTNPMNNLFVCFPGGKTCAGTTQPLNVVQTSVKSLVSIAINPSPASIIVGNTQQFTATATFSDGSTSDVSTSVTWQSNNAAVTISATGLATAASVGSAQITATSGGITSPPATVTVTNPLVSIAVTPPAPSIIINTTQQFTATGTYTDGSTADITTQVTWNSATPSVATIIANTGLATGVGAGTSAITATLGSIVSPSDTLTVINALVSIAITPTNQTLLVTDTLQFTATGTFTDGSTQDITSSVTWSTSKPANATITASGGLATATAFGTSAISATQGSVTSPAITLTIVKYLYAGNTGFNNVVVCTLNTNGALSGCVAANASGSIPQATGVGVNPAKTAVYVASTSGDIYYCTLNTNGTINTCTPTVTLPKPYAVVVNPAGTLAYVVSSPSVNNGSVYYCAISPTTGLLSNCVNALSTANFGSARSITINPAGTFAYVVNNGGSTSFCSIASDGSFTSCSNTGNGFNQPYGIAINPAGTFAYITNFSGNTVLLCPIASDGSFTSCNATGSGFTFSDGVAVNPTRNFVYVADGGNGRISFCVMNSDGTLSSCANTVNGSPLNTPALLAI